MKRRMRSRRPKSIRRRAERWGRAGEGEEADGGDGV